MKSDVTDAVEDVNTYCLEKDTVYSSWSKVTNHMMGVQLKLEKAVNELKKSEDRFVDMHARRFMFFVFGGVVGILCTIAVFKVASGL